MTEPTTPTGQPRSAVADLARLVGGLPGPKRDSAARQLGTTLLTASVKLGKGPKPTQLLPRLVERYSGGPEAWRAWRVFLKAVEGTPLTDEEMVTYRVCTGRQEAPKTPIREAWMVVGRRGGKSQAASLLATWAATCRDYKPYLAPGQRAVVMVIAQNRDKARENLDYINGMLGGPMAPLVKRRVASAIDFHEPVSIEIRTATYKQRGATCPLILCDEIAFWTTKDGSGNPDTEILRALKPGLATIPGSLLIGLSSPYARRGVLWQKYEKFFGNSEASDKAGVLVWQADTLTMHSSELLREEVAAAYEADATSASAEWGAQFRSDIEKFVPIEVVKERTAVGTHELQPELGRHAYFGFVDPSGGRADSYTFAVAHWDKGRAKAVLDLLREWEPLPGKPLSPDRVTEEAAEEAKRFGLKYVTGDNYAGEWPKEKWRNCGVAYQQCKTHASELYLELLPALSSGRAELLDSERLRTQLTSLDRATSRGGKDSVFHPPGGHDDVANAATGALVMAYRIGAVSADQAVARTEAREAKAGGPPPASIEEYQRRKRAEWLKNRGKARFPAWRRPR